MPITDLIYANYRLNAKIRAHYRLAHYDTKPITDLNRARAHYRLAH